MLIDSQVDSLELLSLILVGEGATVVSVATASEALSTLDWFEPDVVITARRLPGIDGVTLISLIRNIYTKNFLAVLLASDASIKDQQKADEAGFHLFFVIPVDYEFLLAKILALLSIPL